MASVHDYKRVENKVVKKFKNVAVIVFNFFIGIFKLIGRFFTMSYTIVLVPHSEKRVYNLHITVLSVCCFLLVVFGLLGAFFLYGTSSYNSAMYAMAGKDGRLKDTQASLDQLRDETALLFREARNFENALSEVLSALRLNSKNNTSQATGDLSSFLGIKETPEGVLPEVDEIKKFSARLSEAVEPIKEIGTLLDSQSALLTEIPSIWPVMGGIGNVTMYFGQNINPISHQYYIHKGIDIATHRSGDPVVATADGQVVTAEYTYDFGNYIIIRHKHGYYTRYAHLSSYRVHVGQRVQQGEVVGYIGNTGISTGPHLHYEVHIGSDVVDPHRYITIRSNIKGH